VPFLYYVLCGADGHHAFSVGYDEFLANVDRCLG
jgi:cell division protein YceG involved in septum cleavage